MAAASAHTLKGSAVGIGAFKVARAAEAVEQAQDASQDAAIAAAIDTLAAVLDEAKAEIARLLRLHELADRPSACPSVAGADPLEEAARPSGRDFR